MCACVYVLWDSPISVFFRLSTEVASYLRRSKPSAMRKLQNSPVKMHTFAPDVTSLHRLTWKQPASRDRQLVYTTLTSQRWIFIRFSTPSRMISLSQHQRLPKWRLEMLQCVWKAIVRCELVADRIGSYSIYMLVFCPQTSCCGILQAFFDMALWQRFESRWNN